MRPMLATRGSHVPSGDGWTHEVKWDGIRLLADVTEADVDAIWRLLELEPDMAESWEIAPDGLTVTLKMRAGVKFHNKAPVNGRLMDMDDVLFSWKRF